jgi:hypothetical protein
VRQFYTAAVQFEFGLLFPQDRLRDGVDDLANETQIARSNGLGRGDADTWGQIGIGAMLGAAPPLIICASFMHQHIAGLTAGATKG